MQGISNETLKTIECRRQISIFVRGRRKITTLFYRDFYPPSGVNLRYHRDHGRGKWS
jgi:hypothetical protein